MSRNEFGGKNNATARDRGHYPRKQPGASLPTQGRSLAGKWEFPGGKLEEGETPEECLVREIEEELGISITVGDIYQAVHTHYDHGDFLLIGYLAEQVDGEISLRVHSDCAWVDLKNLEAYDLAEANIPIAKSLKEESNAARPGVRANSRPD